MLPEPVSASRLKWALPTARRTEPLPVESFQSEVGCPCGFDVAATGAGFEGAGESLKADTAAAGLGFDVAGAGLLEFDVAGAGAEGRGTLDAVARTEPEPLWALRWRLRPGSRRRRSLWLR